MMKQNSCLAASRPHPNGQQGRLFRNALIIEMERERDEGGDVRSLLMKSVTQVKVKGQMRGREREGGRMRVA